VRSRWLVALIAAQIAVIVLFVWVERGRRSRPAFHWERLDEPVPALIVEHDGESVTPPLRPYVVHFWATWCVPCRTELPGLVAAARAEGVVLLAVTDEPWPVVERYFDGNVPTAVMRDPTGDAARAWGVSGLPDTLVVRRGRVVARMGGPRDWATPDAGAFLDTISGSGDF